MENAIKRLYTSMGKPMYYYYYYYDYFILEKQYRLA